MKILVIYTILSYSCISALAQDLYRKYDYTNFRNSELFNQTIDVKNFNDKWLNACLFFATNEIRVSNKLSPLIHHEALEKAAWIHSKDMAEMDFFGHTNKKKKRHREPSDRATIAGILNPSIAENIIEGFVIKYTSNTRVIAGNPGVFKDPETKAPLATHSYISLTDELLRLWMQSEGHRENILSPKAVQLGCGTYLYFMEDFNRMPAVKATQNFQWYELVKNKE
jgi:uncharacterized protein YkwD